MLGVQYWPTTTEGEPMPVTTSQVKQLRNGATEAHRVDIHRLARLLDGIADVAQMLHDGSDLDVTLTLPEVVERAAMVARDLCRDTHRMCAADETAA